MGRPKGIIKTGGRKKGAPNRRSFDAQAKAEEMGVDPFEIMLMFARGDWKGLGYPSEHRERTNADGTIAIGTAYITPDVRISAAKEAVQYLIPKKRAVEHSGSIDGNLNLGIFKVELTSRIAQLKAKK